MIRLAPVLKDRVIFLGWIAGLLLAASLLWALSFSFRANCLMRSTNKILASMDDGRRLSAPLPRQISGPLPLGCWYDIAESESLFFVFVVMHNGILVPCGAEVSAQAELTEIIPLGSHARKVLARIPQGLVQLYVRRIESAAAKEMGAR